uniref:Uncharacterized protein n=1 Tax=Setaria digitata TaxID=48799 RepID=A0A915PLA1_9BILA
MDSNSSQLIGDFLNTELDFVYQRARQLATNLPMLDNRLQGFRISAQDLTGTPISPNLLPRQYLISSRPLKIYHPSSIIAIYVTTIVLISIAPIALYMYGYSKYFISISNARQKSAFRYQANSINGAQSEYSEYRLRSSSKFPQARLCCDGYAPHIFAIILLVLIVVVKAPTIYAHMVIYQHEEKALLLSCIVIDIIFLFAWIILWLILTLKRDWNFKVVHQVHEIIALQNGPQTMITSPTQIIKKKPSELKNALILMHGDQMYLTDDAIAKKSLLRQTQKNGISATGEGIYWLKGNSTQSPTMRRVPCENTKGTPEMNRLLSMSTNQRRSSDENSPTAAYHTIPHTGQPQMTHASQQRIVMNTPKYSTEAKVSANVTVPGNTLGTFQRVQGAEYASCSSRKVLQIPRRPSLQNSVHISSGNNVSDSTAMTQQEAYASIHKSRTGQTETTMTRRRSIEDEAAVNNGFGNTGLSYEAYSTYGRPQTRALQNQQLMQQAAAQAAQAAQTSRNMGTVYSRTQANTSQNITLESGPAPSVLSIRSSPAAENRLGIRTSVSYREQPLYQRASNLKLSSFNSVTPSLDSHRLTNMQQQQHSSAAGSIYGNWSQQRQASEISQGMDWTGPGSYDKTSSAANTSQQEPCFTPTSTLTSQGSASNYSSQRAPTPGSPNTQNIYSGGRFVSGGTAGTVSLYGNLGDDHGILHLEGSDQDRTLRAQQQPKSSRPTVASGSTTTRHQIKVCTGGSRQDDSANYSLTSSNESAENTRLNGQTNRVMGSAEFATSIV